MNFFSPVNLNDHMIPLDFNLFRKILFVTGVTPDFYKTVLMGDADTTVDGMCLRLMTNAIHNEPHIMGLCGETKIGKKSSSLMPSRMILFVQDKESKGKELGSHPRCPKFLIIMS